MIPRSHSAKPSPHDRDRLPVAKEENQGTDLNALNVLGNIPAPTTAVDATLDDGFHLDSGVKVRGGAGVLLVGGEAFVWKPWLARPGGTMAEMVNRKGQFEVDEVVWGLLGVVWPRPGEFFFPLLFPLYAVLAWFAGMGFTLHTGIVLMGDCRSVDYWNGSFDDASVASDKSPYSFSGDSRGYRGYSQCRIAVQHVGYRERRVRGCGCDDSLWMERCIVIMAINSSAVKITVLYALSVLNNNSSLLCTLLLLRT